MKGCCRHGRSRRRLCALAAMVGWLLAHDAAAQGAATVLDGRTLRVGGVTYRLHGIDAPDLKQTCTNRRGKAYRCGAISRTAMMDLVAGARVVCRPLAGAPRTPGRRQPVPARCAADGFDIGGNMVHTGWALADPKAAPPRYRRIEARSRRAGHGLWKGRFMPPWEWRRRAGAGRR